jgi:hypothetical protein
VKGRIRESLVDWLADPVVVLLGGLGKGLKEQLQFFRDYRWPS